MKIGDLIWIHLKDLGNSKVRLVEHGDFMVRTYDVLIELPFIFPAPPPEPVHSTRQRKQRCYHLIGGTACAHVGLRVSDDAECVELARCWSVHLTLTSLAPSCVRLAPSLALTASLQVRLWVSPIRRRNS